MFRAIFVLSVLVSVGLCTIIHYTKCPSVDPSNCNVTEVRIDPCINPKACVLKKGKGAGISFDFVPNFSATGLRTEVTYHDIAFKGLDANACPSTTCPVEPGTTYTYNYNLIVDKKFPAGSFGCVWRLWDESNELNACCFQLFFKLVK